MIKVEERNDEINKKKLLVQKKLEETKSKTNNKRVEVEVVVFRSLFAVEC